MVMIKLFAVCTVFSVSAYAAGYGQYYSIVDNACPGEVRGRDGYGSTTQCFVDAHNYFLNNCLAAAQSSKASCKANNINDLFNDWWTASYRWHLAFYDCLEGNQNRELETRYLGGHGRGKRAAFRQSGMSGRDQANCNRQVKSMLDQCIAETSCQKVLTCYTSSYVSQTRAEKDTKINAYKNAIIQCARGGGSNNVGGAPGTIVDVAVGNPAFSTLVAAVKAADLVSALQAPGPYTVFAPTNDAFAKLGGVVNTLLEPRNKAKLVQVLTYHVVPNAVIKASDIQMGDSQVTSLEGSPIDVRKAMGKVTLNGNSQVVIPNVPASNGIIHAIDSVILPPGFQI